MSGHLCPLAMPVTVVQPGFANGGGGGCGRGFVYDQRGAGHGRLCPLHYASDSGAARICQREGTKAREQSNRAGGVCFPLPQKGDF